MYPECTSGLSSGLFFQQNTTVVFLHLTSTWGGRRGPAPSRTTIMIVAANYQKWCFSSIYLRTVNTQIDDEQDEDHGSYIGEITRVMGQTYPLQELRDTDEPCAIGFEVQQ
jgi:hypothetical protein